MINVHNDMCALWNVQMNKTIDSIDTSRTVVIAGATLGTVWRLVLSAIALFVAGGLAVLLMTRLLTAPPSSGGADYFFMAMGYFFVFLFALIVIVCTGNIFQCWKFLKMSDNVLTITPDGIRDGRVLEEFVPWRAVKSVRTVEHEPDYYLAPQGPGRVTPVRRAMMDVVLDLDPALVSQTFKTQAHLSDIFGTFGHRLPIKDTRPWMTFTIDLWRLKNVSASALYDICEAYATAAQGKRAA
jgi:hypothetical protein